IAANTQTATLDSVKRKLKPDADFYAFERYSHLCARNGKRPNEPRTCGFIPAIAAGDNAKLMMLDADVTDSVIGEGCVIKNYKIHHSVVGLRSCIGEGAIIEDSLLMGEDSYETDADRELLAAKGSVSIGIGKNTRIKRAIIDKNVRIGDDVNIINSGNIQAGGAGADKRANAAAVADAKNALITMLKHIREQVTSGVEELSALMTMRRSMMNRSDVPISNNNGDPRNINADLREFSSAKNRGELPAYNDLGDWKNSLRPRTTRSTYLQNELLFAEIEYMRKRVASSRQDQKVTFNRNVLLSPHWSINSHITLKFKKTSATEVDLKTYMKVKGNQQIHQYTAITEYNISKTVNNSIFKSFLEKEKLSCPNFFDWYGNLRIILTVEDLLTYLEHPIQISATLGQQISADVLAAHTRLVKASNEIKFLILVSMTPELQKKLEHFAAFDMLQESKTIFSHQAEQELLETVKAFHACKQK
ncbi:glucose-1-phosphate adenylyltransferase small subunit, chloroplastic/amyloplastic, partial [Tanacetum coccineum]